MFIIIYFRLRHKKNVYFIEISQAVGSHHIAAVRSTPFPICPPRLTPIPHLVQQPTAVLRRLLAVRLGLEPKVHLPQQATQALLPRLGVDLRREGRLLHLNIADTVEKVQNVQLQQLGRPTCRRAFSTTPAPYR